MRFINKTNNIKNVLILFGSPHKNSYTKKLLEFYINNNLININCKINMVYCYNQHIKSCIDCKFCKKNNFCIFNDMDQINLLLKNSDIIILASPIHNSSISSPLKIILDRMQLYYYYFVKYKKSMLKKPKETIILLTQGSNKNIYIKNILLQIEPVFRTLNAKITKILILLKTDFFVNNE